MKILHKKRRNMAIAGLLTAALLFGMSSPVFSPPAKAVTQAEIDALEDQQDELSQQKEDIQAQLDAINSEVNSQTEQLTLLTAQLEVTNEELENLSEQITLYTNSIAEMENELNEDRLKEQELIEEYKVRIRAMEEGGGYTYFNVIFGATSFADLLSRIDCIMEIMDYDKSLITDVQNAQVEVAAARENMEAEMAAQKEVFAQYQEKQADLQSQQEQVQTVLTSLSADSEEYDQQISDIQTLQASLDSQISSMEAQLEEQKRIEAEQEAARKAAENPLPSTPSTPSDGGSVGSGSGQAIVDYAKSFLGVPYVYGGTSPSGFDCSGLVYYCYRHFGYSINRTAQAQSYNGVSVAKSELQPGDLVFFTAAGSSEIGHVGIYIGNGQYIHAPQTGDVVKISNLSSSTRYWGARRIVTG